MIFRVNLLKSNAFKPFELLLNPIADENQTVTPFYLLVFDCS